MNKEQLDTLRVRGMSSSPVISVDELTNKEDRTLIWGYTCDRDSFHVYLKDETIVAVTYNFDGEILVQSGGAHIEASAALPDKRVYPEASDFEFCALLQLKGFVPPFTTFNDARPQSRFYGRLATEMTSKSSPQP